MEQPASYLISFVLQEAPVHESLSLLDVLFRLGAVLLLVLANGFFVGSEFALVSVRRAKIESRAAAGSSSAQAALRLLHQPTIFISAVQLGVTLASLALGWLGEPTIAAILLPYASRIASSGLAASISHLVAVAVAFSLITFLHILLGELVPKMFALERAESMALFAARPIELFATLFRPVIWLLNYAGSSLGKLLGLRASLEHAAVYTEAELKQLVDISQEKGHLRPAEQRLIHRVFEFSDTLVREAMVPRTQVAAIPASSTLEEIARAFRQHGYSRLPVYRESLDDMIGVIHSKDVMPYLLRPDTFRLEHVLQAPLYVVDTARLEDVLRQMQRAKVHFGFVVDEHGGIDGIITLEDLLEEIVGEISDEHDEEVNEQITEERDGSYLLDGGLAVRDLNRRLGINLPESEAYTTIAGFLMNEAGHVLERGEIIVHDGLTFRIERVDRRRVVSVRLERPEEPEEESQPETVTRAAGDVE
jgi:CBS domain containing-hemolysin-like protein